MKALVMNEYMKVDFVDVPTPAYGEDEALIQVSACGICGSDIHGFDGSTGRRVPPIIMGHEAAGTIYALGKKSAGWRIGQRVTFDSTLFCGECENCRKGQTNLCRNRKVLGVSCKEYKKDGAMAEFVAVPTRTLYEIPQPLSFEEATLVEPLSVATHAVRKLGIQNSGVAVVVGAGIIGLLALQVLKHDGCTSVVSIDKDPQRLLVAKSLGADLTIDPRTEDVRSIIHDHTNDRGADYAVEAVGVSKSIATAVSVLKPGGKMVLIGNVSPTAEFPLQDIVTNELAIFGTYISSGEYKECLDLICSGAVNVKKLISATPYLGEGAAWLQKLYKAEGNLLKVVLRTARSS